MDKETKTTFWHDAIQKEMRKIKIAFQFLDEEDEIAPGYNWIKCHLIFSVKMDLTRKARFNPPSELMYSSLVTRDSMHIAFLLAVLSDVNLLATDIGNAYLNAKSQEKVYSTAGPELGAELQGRNMIKIRALYGLKSSGATWRAHLASTRREMGFISCLADPNI